MLPDIFKVQMFQEQEDRRQQDAHHQQKERAQKLLQRQRIAALLYFLAGFARPGHPISPQSLQISWNGWSDVRTWQENLWTWKVLVRYFARLVWKKHGNTVISVVEQPFIEHLQILGIPGERKAVSRHGIPWSDRQQSAILILSDQVIQDSAIVDERIHLSAEVIIGYYRSIMFRWGQDLNRLYVETNVPRGISSFSFRVIYHIYIAEYWIHRHRILSVWKIRFN